MWEILNYIYRLFIRSDLLFTNQWLIYPVIRRNCVDKKRGGAAEWGGESTCHRPQKTKLPSLLYMLLDLSGE